MSWKPEVIADNTGKWVGNGLRFATREEALDNVRNLEMRWTAVRDTRVVEGADPVNYSYHNGQLRQVEAPKPEKLKCSICALPIPVEHGTWKHGHNAEPVNKGRCCRDCEINVVLPARLMKLSEKLIPPVSS